MERPFWENDWEGIYVWRRGGFRAVKEQAEGWNDFSSPREAVVKRWGGGGGTDWDYENPDLAQA